MHWNQDNYEFTLCVSMWAEITCECQPLRLVEFTPGDLFIGFLSLFFDCTFCVYIKIYINTFRFIWRNVSSASLAVRTMLMIWMVLLVSCWWELTHCGHIWVTHIGQVSEVWGQTRGPGKVLTGGNPANVEPLSMCGFYLFTQVSLPFNPCCNEKRKQTGFAIIN